MTRIVGIDPGLVHTGIVALDLDAETKTHSIHFDVVTGVPLSDGRLNVNATVDAIVTTTVMLDGLVSRTPDHIFIERYEPRSHFGTDADMAALVRGIHARAPHSKVISNTGSKQVLKPKLMQALRLKKFPATHHQDLQAAARILVYGALKDETLNALIYQFVEDHLDGIIWKDMP